ncbi:MAG: tetratricopeptide repeat protein [Gammaproteobacteria bacterium]|nr:tetratricopeptide repeat protein [Gammaproteobacteria bacterium]
MKTTPVLLGIFALLLVVISGCLLFYPMGYLYATYENLYGEWLQFSAFTGIVIVSVLIVKHQGSIRAWFWVLLGLAAFYTAMEEISWGQQVLGWKSPEFFQRENLQGETNLHNMLTGPYSTLLKDVLTWVLAAGIFVYGVIYPVLLHYRVGIARFGQRLGVAAPPLCLTPMFAMAAVSELGFFNFNEAELAELFVALALLFFAVLTYGKLHSRSEERVARNCVVVFVVAIASSIMLTQISIHSSTSSKRVANRIEAGVKKFAGRYARVGAWNHSINLYERHLAYAPDSRSRIRRLANAYASAGRPDDQQSALNTALQLDLALLEKDPWRASVHRSLYRTYTALGAVDNAAGHLEEALTINQRRLRDHPKSAAAAYSMARTLDLLGRRIDAIKQYKRAFDLKPDSSTYRRAYREATE